MYVSSRFERLDCANGNPVALEAGQHRVDGASANHQYLRASGL